MSPQTLEIRHVATDCHEHMTAALIAIATGYDLAEVWERLPARLKKSHGWYGRDFRETFNMLGFDCSPDFRAKFDPNTERICLMRYKATARCLVEERQALRQRTGNPKAQLTEYEKNWWDAVVYYKGLIYAPHFDRPIQLKCDFVNRYYRPTSMMQVWLSDL